MMKNNLKKVYHDFVSNNFINFDQRQVDLLETIEKVWKENIKINFFYKTKKFNGIYVFGSVGIGKTFIINLFINSINESKKIHFNHFMIDLHAFINNDKKDFSLEAYIKNYSKKIKVLFIDELHIFNIVDALLIKKIFLFFKKYKIFILISSNFKPSDLYLNGLQRNDFIPFISILKKSFKVIHLENIKDYRRQMLNQSKTYFTPINDETSNEFNRLFKRFVDQGEIFIRKIQTKSRIIRFEKSTSNIVYCSFKDLCEVSLSHEDYKNIAKAFRLLFINKVPLFTEDYKDQCRRFINLIDMLYDQGCSVVLLAEKPINKLCQIKNLIKEFERTASRLYEMTIVNKKI